MFAGVQTKRLCRGKIEAVPLQILSVGHDPGLLETRRLLLESAAFAVVSESNVLGAIERLRHAVGNATDGFDVIILCHTLKAFEADSLRQLVSETLPQTRVIRLHKAEDGTYEPARFMQTVIRVACAERKPMQRAHRARKHSASGGSGSRGAA